MVGSGLGTSKGCKRTEKKRKGLNLDGCEPSDLGLTGPLDFFLVGHLDYLEMVVT